jgi:hypothetical protein
MCRIAWDRFFKTILMVASLSSQTVSLKPEVEMGSLAFSKVCI